MRIKRRALPAWFIVATFLMALPLSANGAQQSTAQKAPPSTGVDARVSGIDTRVSSAVEGVDVRVTTIEEPTDQPAAPSGRPAKPASSWSSKPASPTSGASRTPQRSSANEPTLNANSPSAVPVSTLPEARPNASAVPKHGALANSHGPSAGAPPDSSFDRMIKDSRATASRMQPKPSQTSSGGPRHSTLYQPRFAPEVPGNPITSRHPTQHAAHPSHTAKKSSHGLNAQTSTQAKPHSHLTLQSNRLNSVK